MALYLTLDLVGEDWIEKEREILYRILNQSGLITIKKEKELYYAEEDQKTHTNTLNIIIPKRFSKEEVTRIIRMIHVYCYPPFTYRLSRFPIGKVFRAFAKKQAEKRNRDENTGYRERT